MLLGESQGKGLHQHRVQFLALEGFHKGHAKLLSQGSGDVPSGDGPLGHQQLA